MSPVAPVLEIVRLRWSKAEYSLPQVARLVSQRLGWGSGTPSIASGPLRLVLIGLVGGAITALAVSTPSRLPAEGSEGPSAIPQVGEGTPRSPNTVRPPDGDPPLASGEPRSVKRPTPMAPEAAADHLAEAWKAVTGETANDRTLAVLWAQWALETGRGTAMLDNNFAGLKGRGPRGDSAVRWTWERSSGGVERLRRRFRAYGSPLEGARDYVVVLRDRFSEAFAAARAGDASNFARALARAGYHTADASEYERALRLLCREHLAQQQERRASLAPQH